MRIKKYHIPYQRLMGHLTPDIERDPKVEFTYIDISDNSRIMRDMEEQHPRIVAFERKYQDVNWRARLT